VHPSVAVMVAGGPVGSPALHVLEGVRHAMSQTNFWLVVTVMVLAQCVDDGRQVVQGHSSMTDTVQALVMVGGGRVLISPLVHVAVGTAHSGQATGPVGTTVTVAVL
jgi:hypothetical protein